MFSEQALDPDPICRSVLFPLHCGHARDAVVKALPASEGDQATVRHAPRPPRGSPLWPFVRSVRADLLVRRIDRDGQEAALDRRVVHVCAGLSDSAAAGHFDFFCPLDVHDEEATVRGKLGQLVEPVFWGSDFFNLVDWAGAKDRSETFARFVGRSFSGLDGAGAGVWCLLLGIYLSDAQVCGLVFECLVRKGEQALSVAGNPVGGGQDTRHDFHDRCPGGNDKQPDGWRCGLDLERDHRRRVGSKLLLESQHGRDAMGASPKLEPQRLLRGKTAIQSLYAVFRNCCTDFEEGVPRTFTK